MQLSISWTIGLESLLQKPQFLIVSRSFLRIVRMPVGRQEAIASTTFSSPYVMSGCLGLGEPFQDGLEMLLWSW